MRVAILGRAAEGSRGASMLPIAVRALEEAGYEVCLPHGEAPATHKATPAEARAAMAALVGSDGVAVPLWWRECEGAAIELRVVQAMGGFGLIRVMDYLDWIEYAPSILRTGGDGPGTDYLA